MVKSITITAVVAALFLAGCTSRTEHGECIGLGERKDPALTYKVSARNLVVAIVFAEMIVPPVIVAMDEFYCPVGKRP